MKDSSVVTLVELEHFKINIIFLFFCGPWTSQIFIKLLGHTLPLQNCEIRIMIILLCLELVKKYAPYIYKINQHAWSTKSMKNQCSETALKNIFGRRWCKDVRENVAC